MSNSFPQSYCDLPGIPFLPQIESSKNTVHIFPSIDGNEIAIEPLNDPFLAPTFDHGYNEMTLQSAEPFMRKVVIHRDCLIPVFDNNGNVVTFKPKELVQYNIHHAIPVELFRKLSTEALKDILSPIKGLGTILTQLNYPRGDSFLNIGTVDEFGFHKGLTTERDSFFNTKYAELPDEVRVTVGYQDFILQRISEDWRNYPINQYLALSMIAINIFNTASLCGCEHEIYKRLRKKRTLANKDNMDRRSEKEQKQFIDQEIQRALKVYAAAAETFPELYNQWSSQTPDYSSNQPRIDHNEGRRLRGKTPKWGYDTEM